jgi:Lon protease-like protein
VDERTDAFPLFPLDLVALPSELVPLHIFEARYRTMIERCLDEDSEFGIVWLSEDDLAQVGCACEIERVLERLEDGRMNILVRGTRPFRLIVREDHLPYPAGTVEFLDDDAESLDAAVGERVRKTYAELVEQATDNEPDLEELAAMDAYEIAATIDFGLDAKQGLLELRSENARMHQVLRLLRAALKRLEFVERAQARARSNGKIRFG